MYIKGYTSNNTSVLRYLPTNPNIFSAKGEVIALIGVDPIADYPVDRIIKFVWDAVIEKYLSSQFGPLDSLKSALKAGEYELRNLIRGDEYLENTGVNLNLTILAVRGNSLYVARLGDQQILLWRNGKYIDVGEILDTHKVVAGSSAIERDDYLVVATKVVGQMIKSKEFSFQEMDQISQVVSDDQGYLISSMLEPTKEQLNIDINGSVSEVDGKALKVDDAISRIIDGDEDLRDNDFNDGIKSIDSSDSNERVGKSIHTTDQTEDKIVITQYSEVQLTSVTKDDDFIDLDKQEDQINKTNDDNYEEDEEDIESDVEEGIVTKSGAGIEEDTEFAKKNNSENEFSEENNNEINLEDRNTGEPAKIEDKMEIGKEDLSYDSEKYQEAKNLDSLDDKMYVNMRETSDSDIEQNNEIRETGQENASKTTEVLMGGLDADNQQKNDTLLTAPSICSLDAEKHQEDKLILPAPYVGSSKFKKLLYNIKVVLIKIGLALKKFWNWLLKVSGVLGGGVGKIGEKIDIVGGKVKVSIDDKLGRKMWYKKLMAKFSQMQFSRPRGQIKGMKIDGYRYSDQRKKRIGLIIIILLVGIILFFGIRFIIISKNESEIHKQVTSYYQESVTLVDEAERVVRENPTLAQTNIINANSKITSANEIVLWDKDITLLEELKVRATKVEDIIYRRVGISDEAANFELFIDAKMTFGDNANPTDMIAYQNTSNNQFIFVTDRGTKAVYRLSLYDKKLLKIGDENLVASSPENIDIGINGDVFVYDKSAGMLKSTLGEDGNYSNLTSLSPLTGSSLAEKGVTDLAIFGGEDSIFYTSRTDKSIYKAPNVGNAYGFPQLFVSDSSFGQINDLFGDNFIYAFSGGSEPVSRFYFSGGDDLGINITGVNPPIQDITCAFSFWTVNHKMYLWDEPNKRIIVLEKPNDETDLHTDSLVFLKQYVYRGTRDDVFNDVKEIVTDWDENYMYVLDGLRIWKIKL